MALTAKLVMRQGQALVMTPQLMQAIKLLQLSNLDLAAFVEEELERNPLLERADETDVPDLAASAEDDAATAADPTEDDWSRDDFATDRVELETSLGTELGNAFEHEGPGSLADRPADGLGLTATSWTGSPSSGGAFDNEDPDIERYVAAVATLHDHLAAQLVLALVDPVDRLIGHAIIDAIDDAGYLAESLETIAQRLGATLERAEAILAVIHDFDPTGIGARSVAECLSIQLRERDRFDPAMAALVANLELLAKRDHAGLKRVCGVDDEDLAEMIGEIRGLDPKPGRGFGGGSIQAVVPDVFVRAAPDGSWLIDLNTEVLPRVLISQSYHARVSRRPASEADRTFVAGCLQTANWLTKSLEQRARTILKVSSEIVRQQDAFFAQGVEFLRPLNLKTVADAIGMHESTVSRVTSNKYMASPRGIFELKYFFTAAIASTRAGASHSAEAVRFRIKQMIDAESPSDILSDDAIVVRLKSADIDIARRTVAKYRESLRIPSSVERRREKQPLAMIGP